MLISKRPNASENMGSIFLRSRLSPSQQCASAEQAWRLVVIDEIGPMEFRSAIFRDAGA
jgi:nucleoside-triphosphatase THEP1